MHSLFERTRHEDVGFSLIEAIVALLIAGVVFGALATTLVASMQASLFGRQNQQATDFMTREVEQLRALSFGALSNSATDVAADPRLVACGSARCLVVDGVAEPVVTAVAGTIGVAKVLNAAEANHTTFTLSRYVTQIADQPVGQAKRATVYITWLNKGTLKTRTISTVIAYTQAGLPLPVFKLELPVPTVTINPDARVTFAFTLTNQGAPDRWNLARTGSAAGWVWYADSDGNGMLDLALDSLLTDTTSDGGIDTGRVDPSTTFRFFLTRDTLASEPLATTTTTITATSFGQPLAAGAAKSVIGTTIVAAVAVGPTVGPTSTPTATPTATPAPETTCPAAVVAPNARRSGYTQFTYAMHSTGLGDVALQSQMYFDTTTADESVLMKYSTDIDAVATGRVLAPAAATSPAFATVLGLSNTRLLADWALQYGSRTTVEGTGVLRLWAARSGAGAANVTVKVVLYSATGSSSGLTRTKLAEAEVSLGTLTCAGFQEFYVKLPDVNAIVIAKNAWLGLRVVTWGTDSVRLGYDVPASAGVPFPASFTIGTK
ncbi:hypothetical protein [Pengzhenrongella phosphoraccumulans]|uniref:hypothetical protein n=1 Tax=Pengzhenrongella phosphoraccumulans TaxID=3114394 RepID=UPI003890BE21